MPVITVPHVTKVLAGCLVALTTGCVNIPTEKVQAHYWSHNGTHQFTYPEKRLAEVWNDLSAKDDLGICFSGGGTRAAVAAAGQLRALNELGILNRVRYVSAVSGGAWAATPYTFIENNKLPEFLGAYIAPENLQKAHLEPSTGSLAEASTKAAVVWQGIGRVALLRGSESYARTISQRFLKPFGIDGSDSWFSWNEATARDIRARNPDVPQLADPPVTVPKGRPFLIACGTIRNYDLVKWGTFVEKRIPFEMTPLYSGTPSSWYPNRHYRHPIGGGFIESFAFDSVRPIRQANGVAEAKYYTRPPYRNHSPLTLGDMVGVSGAALGEVQAPVIFLGHPRFNSWSPRALDSAGYVQDQRENYQDGGHSDNLGIMPLLARRVKTIIAFVNAEAPIETGTAQRKTPDYVRALFGDTEGEAKSKLYHDMQVFEPSDLAAVHDEVRRSISAKGPAVAETTLTTKHCPRFGVSKYTVRVIWVFLEGSSDHGSASQNWKRKIHEKEVKDHLDLKMPHFPRIKTFFENKDRVLWDVITLKPEQASLLSHYTAWSVVHSPVLRKLSGH